MNIQRKLVELFSAAIGEEAEVTQSRKEGFGHYQCNSAMRLGKKMGKPPREVAEEIVEKVERGSLIKSMEVAGPGFINISLSKEFLSGGVDGLVRDKRCGIAPVGKRERVIVEYSSPNTAKEMHVGHLRSTIIGESLARMLEFAGHDVLRLNHIGDWGTQFGMLIAFMKEEAPEILGGKEGAELSDLVTFYKAAKKRFDEDAEFKKRAQEEVVELQGGNEQSLKAWEKICEVSRKGYQRIYDQLDIHLVERGESTYNSELEGIVEDLVKREVAVDNGGAKCVFLPGFTNREGEPLPQIIQKSDGGYNYSTTDLAAIRQRVEEERADWIIYVVDSGQKIHFEMLFETARRAGYVGDKTQLDHAGFGLVLGADGKRFRTRAGDTEKLSDLLDAAVEQARRILQERLPDASSGELDQAAERLGLGAVKYADLSQHRITDYQFSYERMLSLEGNTAAFLLYSFVRISSIKRKVGVDIGEVMGQANIKLEHPSEIGLGLHLLQFEEALDGAVRELLPNRITDYLYGLAGKFNAFFRDCHVQGTEEESSRLLLCEATAQVMEKGLNLLGIQTLERM